MNPNREEHACPECGRGLPASYTPVSCPQCLLRRFAEEEPSAGEAVIDELRLELEAKGFSNLQLVAQGGMGMVFHARQPSLSREVAIKVILPGLGWDGDILARFHLEAETSGSLNHPNILSIYELGFASRVPYMVCRWIPGGSLAKQINGDLSREQTGQHDSTDRSSRQVQRSSAELLRQIADGLDFAHSRGVLHRDLKPANILIGESRVPLIADFGLAKLLSKDSALTRSRSVVGTPCYMAPEVVDRQETTVRSDVYSLGVILFELLTGIVPFRESSDYRTFRAVMELTPPSPESIVPGLDPDLCAICLKCLRKEPSERYASAGDLAGDLSRYLAGEPILARVPGSAERALRWARRHKSAAAACAAVVLAVLVSAAGIFSAWRVAESQRRLASREAAQSKLLVAHHLQEQGRVADSLKQLIQAIRLDPNNDLCRSKLLGTLGYQPLLLSDVRCYDHPGGLWDFVPSSDGRTAVSVCFDRLIRIWDLRQPEKPMKELPWDANVHSADLSSDGRYMAVASNFRVPGIYDVGEGKWRDTDRTAPALMHKVRFHPTEPAMLAVYHDGTIRLWNTEAGLIFAEAAHRGPARAAAFSPDGSRFATGSDDGQAFVWRWGEVPTNGRSLDHDAKPVSSLAFSRCGSWLLTGSADGKIRVWDALRGGLVATTVLEGRPAINSITVSPDNTVVLAGGNDGSIWSCNLTGGVLSPPSQLPSGVMSIRFEAPGERVVAGLKNGLAVSWRYGQERLMPLARFDPGIVSQLKWLPQREALLGEVFRQGLRYREGRNLEKATFLTTNELKSKIAMTGDRNVALTAKTNQTSDVWDFGGNDVQRRRSLRHTSNVWHVAVSPDGALGALVDFKKIKLFPLSGPDLAPLELDHPEILTRAEFGRDCQRLFTAGHDGKVRAWRMPRGELEPVLYSHHGFIDALEISCDGRWLATGSQDSIVKVFDLDQSRLAHDSLIHDGPILRLAFSADSSFLAVLTGDYELVVWDLRTSPAAKTRVSMEGGVWCIEPSPQGHWLAVGGWLGHLRVYDMESGLPITPPLPHLNSVTALEFTPDGRFLYSGSNDRGIRIWPLPSAAPQISTAFLDWLENRLDTLWSGPPGSSSPSGNGILAFAGGEMGAFRHWLEHREGPVLFSPTPSGETSEWIESLGRTPDEIAQLYSMWLRPRQPLVMARIGESLAKAPFGDRAAASRKMADWFARAALDLLPGNREVLQLRASQLRFSGRSEAAREIERQMGSRPSE